MKRALRYQRQSAGLSLVELLVAMAIGLVLTLAVATVMVTNEGRKRTINSVNDVNQTGAYASFVLDRALRSAGTGFAQRWQDVFGCRLNVSLNNTVILPRPGPLPAPFAAVPNGSLRLAPVTVVKGAGATGSDVLVVMAGTAGFGEAAARVLPASITANGLRLPNTLGLRGNDLVMVAEAGLPGCLVEQVQAGFAGTSNQQLNFAGAYYSPTGTDVNLASFGGSVNTTYVMTLGNAVDNPPQFQLYGVDPANDTLVGYDLLRVDGTDAPVQLAEGVVQIRALYGVDTNGDGRQDAWVDPGVAPWDATTLLNGSAASQLNLRRIVTLRLGMVLRTALVERTAADANSATTISLFSDLGPALQQTRPLTAAEQQLRHRTVDVVIPLRNILMLP